MRLGVVGLGYVGLPLAVGLANAGHSVIGWDRDQERVLTIQAGIAPELEREPDLPDLLWSVLLDGSLSLSVTPTALQDCEAVLVAVPTPIDSLWRAHYDDLLTALEVVREHLPPGGLVVVESTIGPGTCDQLLKPRLPDHALAHCPERIMPGRSWHNLTTLPRVLGADSEATGQLLRRIYEPLTTGKLTVTDLRTAEIVKTAENAYRDTMIAFANELAYLCEGYGADVWLVRDLINALGDRWVLEPGAGVGGHCLPKDTYLLMQQRESVLLLAVRQVNEWAPIRLGELIITTLGRFGVEMNQAQVVLLGETYRPDVPDIRNSPTKTLERYLYSCMEIVIHDPYTRPGDVYALARSADALVLMTAHQVYAELDFARLREVMRTPVLIDGRGLWRHNPPDGFEYVLIGRG